MRVGARMIAAGALCAALAVSGTARADDAAARRAYDAAFEALAGGDLTAAEEGFARAAAEADDAELRAAAGELARLARTLRERGATVTFSAPGVAPPARPAPPASDRDDGDAGRASFIVTTTMTSIYAGVALLDLLDIDDFRAGVALVSGTTAVGFVGSFFASRPLHITQATADAYGFGLGIGAGNGLLLAPVLGADSTEGFQIAALTGLAVGGGTGFVLARHTDPTRGQVTVTATTSALGLATVALGFGVIQPDSLDEDAALLSLTAGLDVGAIAGIAAARRIDWSTGRARFVGLGTFLGGLGGWSIAALITGGDPSDDDARVWSGAALGGLWGGFALTTFLTKDMAPDPRYRDRAARGVQSITPTRVGEHGYGFALGGRF